MRRGPRPGRGCPPRGRRSWPGPADRPPSRRRPAGWRACRGGRAGRRERATRPGAAGRARPAASSVRPARRPDGPGRRPRRRPRCVPAPRRSRCLSWSWPGRRRDGRPASPSPRRTVRRREPSGGGGAGCRSGPRCCPGASPRRPTGRGAARPGTRRPAAASRAGARRPAPGLVPPPGEKLTARTLQLPRCT
ncbi:hypothetical protein [Ornithinimicrobium kibberense]|uniref:hypothetical protein n=1 Tax=Ornithinimicrobium kibberense TaxID=282060 RepID=UPI00361918A5